MMRGQGGPGGRGGPGGPGGFGGPGGPMGGPGRPFFGWMRPMWGWFPRWRGGCLGCLTPILGVFVLLGLTLMGFVFPGVIF